MSAREEAYDAELFPLMSQVIEVCKRHGIPVFAAFEITDADDEEPGWCTTSIVPADSSPQLLDIARRWESVRRPALVALTIVSSPKAEP